MTFSEYVKTELLTIIDEMNDFSWMYSKNPEVDFSRTRKMKFKSTLRFILSMENSSLKSELLKYFRFDERTPSKKNTFDYLNPDNHSYTLNLRVVRFAIRDDSYETIITNLPQQSFKTDEIKRLYAMRWGIETSFRELYKFHYQITNISK